MKSFSADLSAFIAKAQGNMDKVVQGVTTEVAERLVSRTPVLSGAARGNWTAGIGAPDTAPTGRLDPSGAETVAAIAGEVTAARAGSAVYVTNSSAYIRDLEDGSSTQAPNGMVASTLSEAGDIVRVVAERLNR